MLLCHESTTPSIVHYEQPTFDVQDVQGTPLILPVSRSGVIRLELDRSQIVDHGREPDHNQTAFFAPLSTEATDHTVSSNERILIKASVASALRCYDIWSPSTSDLGIADAEPTELVRFSVREDDRGEDAYVDLYNFSEELKVGTVQQMAGIIADVFRSARLAGLEVSQQNIGLVENLQPNFSNLWGERDIHLGRAEPFAKKDLADNIEEYYKYLSYLLFGRCDFAISVDALPAVPAYPETNGVWGMPKLIGIDYSPA